MVLKGRKDWKSGKGGHGHQLRRNEVGGIISIQQRVYRESGREGGRRGPGCFISRARFVGLQQGLLRRI